MSNTQASTKKNLILMAVGFAMVLGSWAVLALRSYQGEKDYKKELQTWRSSHRADSVALAQYKADKELTDFSVMALKVENGQLSIELNRKQAKIEEATTKYTNYRKSHEIDSALSTCDSIIYHYVPEYLEADSAYQVNTDSTVSLIETWSKRQDLIINSNFTKLDSISTGEIIKLETPVKVKTPKNKRHLTWGLVGVAVGVILAEVFGK
jgi:hypothetical protein